MLGLQHRMAVLRYLARRLNMFFLSMRRRSELIRWKLMKVKKMMMRRSQIPSLIASGGSIGSSEGEG